MNTQLRENIFKEMMSVSCNSEYERIAISCVLYKYLMSLTDIYEDKRGNLNQLVKSYKGMIVEKVQNMKNVYISYDLMIKHIMRNKKESFYNYMLSDIEEVYEIYLNKIKVVPFSNTYFSQYMYKVLNLIRYQYIELNRIHNEIITQIVEYYIDKNEINPNQMQIYDAEGAPDFPGKEILFNIEGISNAIILRDIKKRNIDINYYSVSTYGNYIKLLLN